MTFTLLHGSVLAGVGLATDQQEADRVIKSLTAWSKAFDDQPDMFHISEWTRRTLAAQGLMPDLRVLNRVYVQFGNGRWNPNLLFAACFRMLAAQSSENSMLNNEALYSCERLQLIPSTVEDDLPNALQDAARADAALLAREQIVLEDAFDWIVAASTRQDLSPRVQVRTAGQVEVLKPDGTTQVVEADGQLSYVFDPDSLSHETDNEALFARVRSRVAGKNALLIGGDGRNFAPDEYREQLGLNDAVFVPHCDGHGQNIKRTRQMLRSGHYHLYVHFIKFSSHSPSNLKQDCPDGCHYIPVNGSATVANVARAIAYTLQLRSDKTATRGLGGDDLDRRT